MDTEPDHNLSPRSEMLDPLIQTVTDFWAAQIAVSPTHPVLLSFSGGPDSVILLHWALSYFSSQHIILVYFDHQIREKGVQKDKSIVTHYAQRYALETIIESIDVPTHSRIESQSMEVAGRELRYSRLTSIARVRSISMVLTGHHRDDSCETFLYQMIRGSKASLGGIKFRRNLAPSIELFRPLLNLNKEQILAYLTRHNLPYSIDETNSDTTIVRNKIRHQLLPLITSINPNFRHTIHSYLSYLDSQQAFLERLIQPHLHHIQQAAAQLTIPLAQLQDLDPFLLAYLLYRSIRHTFGFDYPITSPHIESILAQRQKPGTQYVSLPQGIVAVINPNRISIAKPHVPLPPFHYAVTRDSTQSLTIPQLGQTITIQQLTQPQSKPDSNQLLLDMEKISSLPLQLRNRREGDRFDAPGISGTRKLKKVLNELKIPREERDCVLLLCTNDVVLWIVGYAKSNTYSPNSQTATILELRVTPGVDH